MVWIVAAAMHRWAFCAGLASYGLSILLFVECVLFSISRDRPLVAATRDNIIYSPRNSETSVKKVPFRCDSELFPLKYDVYADGCVRWTFDAGRYDENGFPEAQSVLLPRSQPLLRFAIRKSFISCSSLNKNHEPIASGN